MVLCQIGSVPDGKEMARWHGTLAWDPSRQDSGTRLYTVISNLHTGPCIAYSVYCTSFYSSGFYVYPARRTRAGSLSVLPSKLYLFDLSTHVNRLILTESRLQYCMYRCSDETSELSRVCTSATSA